MTKVEWEAKADEMFADGKTPQEINKVIGTYNGPEGTFTIQQAAKSKRGFTVVDKNKRKERNAKRNNAIKEQDDKLLETLKKGGMSDEEARAVLKKEKAGYARIEHQAKELNKEFGKGSFNAGHETAALEGGGNYGRNARLEIGKSRTRADGTRMRGNQSRGKIDEAPDFIKPVMGIPRSGRGGEDTALFNLLERDNPGIMDLGLTPKDRQDIKRNPIGADDIIADRQIKISKLGMRRNMLRLGTALPLAGLGIGLGQAGHAASQGDYAGAAAHGVGALVGEVPIIGDVAVESVAGTSVADGELAPNLAKVDKALKIGPEPVNLDPTGDEDFDAVAQPFLKMLQLK